MHRYKIQDDGTGRLKAVDGYAKGEILASSDERFRPVNMLGGPDGTLYVVDMYRGIVQEQIYWTDFLRDYIKAHDLERPVNLGRIWRIVHSTTKREQKPALSKAAPAELVKTLTHANGWWRDTAQRLLVERGDKSAVPALRQLAQQTPDWRFKLHALWTLDGLGELEAAEVQRALGDKSPDVRAGAVRLSERWLSQPDQPLAAAVLKLIDDPSWTVRRQLAATIGELPAPARLDPAVAILTKYGADAITVDVTISGLRGAEMPALTRVAAAPAAPRDAVRDADRRGGAQRRFGSGPDSRRQRDSGDDAGAAAAGAARRPGPGFARQRRRSRRSRSGRWRWRWRWRRRGAGGEACCSAGRAGRTGEARGIG